MEQQQPNQLLGKTPYETVSTPASGDPFRVILTGSGIEITGPIDCAERADELVRAVNALKPLLRPVEQPTPSDSATSQPTTSASVPFMITIGQKGKLKALGYSEDRIRDMRPQEAHDLLKSSAEGRGAELT
jgi:hypothetical protein